MRDSLLTTVNTYLAWCRRHVLRMVWEVGFSRRQIARSLNLSPTTVGEYLHRARAAGLSRPLPEVFHDAELETLSDEHRRDWSRSSMIAMTCTQLW